MIKPNAIHDSKVSDTVWLTLRLVFGLVPIVAGLDKFTNLLVDWSRYLAPFIAHMVPPHGFMIVVGIIEIIAGIGVLFYDIAVRDVVMAISAFCLARLTAPATERVGAMRQAPAH